MAVSQRNGKKRKRVNIRSLQGTGKGVRGQASATWTIFKNDVPCSITPLSGRELEIARQLVPTATHRVEMQFMDDIDEKMRLTDRSLGSRVLNIDNYQDVDERRRKLRWSRL